MRLLASSKYLKKIPNQVRSRETVAAIIQACAQIVAKEGHGALTTDYIARVAGVSVGSIYQYFETKDAIILALMMETVAEFYQKIQTLLHGEDGRPLNPLDHIPTIVDAMLEVHGESPEAFGALMEYLAVQGQLQIVETVFREVEAWVTNFFIENGYVAEEVAGLRARSLVHGVAAIIRVTLRYTPTTIRDVSLRDELRRLVFLIVFGEMPDELKDQPL